MDSFVLYNACKRSEEMFKKIESIEEIRKIIASNEFTFVYFTQPNCSVCHGLKPQVESKLKEFEHEMTFIEVDAVEVPQVSGEFAVMTAPVILLFVEGKEYMRKARFIPVQELYHDVKKIIEGMTSARSIERV